MKTRFAAFALLLCAPLLVETTLAHPRGKAPSQYKVVSGGHSHSVHGVSARPPVYATRYPRFYQTNVRSSYGIYPRYPEYYSAGYRPIRTYGGATPRYYYKSRIGYIGRPYIHVRNDWDGCHPYYHHYHHDDSRLYRIAVP